MYHHSFYVPEDDTGHKNKQAYSPICFPRLTEGQVSPNEQQKHLLVL
jgi:hypothetical protein